MSTQWKSEYIQDHKFWDQRAQNVEYVKDKWPIKFKHLIRDKFSVSGFTAWAKKLQIRQSKYVIDPSKISISSLLNNKQSTMEEFIDRNNNNNNNERKMNIDGDEDDVDSNQVFPLYLLYVCFIFC